MDEHMKNRNEGTGSPSFPWKGILAWMGHLGTRLSNGVRRAWRSVKDFPPYKRNMILAITGMFLLLLVGGAAIGLMFSSVGLGIAYAAVVTFVWLGIILVAGSSILPLLSGARRVRQSEVPELVSIVDNLAHTAGIPVPALWISNALEINAFACGRSSKHAAVVITQGGINTWDADELEGILAHEVAHIRNKDVLVSTLMYAILNGMRWSALLVMKPMEWTIQFFGKFLEGDGWWSALSGFIVLSYGVLLRVLDYVFGAILFPLAMLAQRAASRQQEFHADESGAELIGNGHGLAKALAKILVTEKEANRWAMAFSAKSSGSQIWSTHPPTAKRIERLGEDTERLIALVDKRDARESDASIKTESLLEKSNSLK